MLFLYTYVKVTSDRISETIPWATGYRIESQFSKKKVNGNRPMEISTVSVITDV